MSIQPSRPWADYVRVVQAIPGKAITRADDPCIARQPILDRDGKVFGYELLFRRSSVVQTCDVDSNLASARVIVDAVLATGLDTLTGGKRAFVNVSRDVLLGGAVTLLPRDQVIVELLEDVFVDDEVFAACSELKQAGYALALDDFTYREDVARLLPLADYVKVDLLQSQSAAERTTLMQSLQRYPTRWLAEKVETPEQREEAAAQGFTYFQGFYFGRPVVREVKRMAARRAAYATLLAQLNKPDISVQDLENVVKQDASLSVRVLRALNSAGTPLRVEISSIRQAIILLGRDTIRRWASLWAMASMNEHAHPELVASSIIRARCCEMVDMQNPNSKGNGFLLGLCSLLDAILEQPMDGVVAQLPIDAEIRAALLGEPNQCRALLDCTIAYERGDWDRFESLAAEANVEGETMRTAYHEALRWTRQLKAAAA